MEAGESLIGSHRSSGNLRSLRYMLLNRLGEGLSPCLTPTSALRKRCDSVVYFN